MFLPFAPYIFPAPERRDIRTEGTAGVFFAAGRSGRQLFLVTVQPSAAVCASPAALAALLFPARLTLPSPVGQHPARIPVRGVISTPVLRLRTWNALLPFAALVPLRDYPSGSVPCKEPCRATARTARAGDTAVLTQNFYLHPQFFIPEYAMASLTLLLKKMYRIITGKLAMTSDAPTGPQSVENCP